MSFIVGPIGGGGSSNSFTIVQPDSGTSPTATSSSDTLSLTSSDKSIAIVGNSGTDTINFISPAEKSNGSSSTTLTVDFSTAVLQTITLTANCTLTFSNPGANGAIYVLRLLQDGTGNRTVTWPASVLWPKPSGSAPTLGTAGQTDVVTLYYNGTKYLASSAGYAT